MYSSPLIVAPAAAVGTGSCQTTVRLRLDAGSASANAAETSSAVPSGIAINAVRRARAGPVGDLPALGGVVKVGGDLGLADRDPRPLR